MHVVFYGPEGSGKGTQAKLLAKTLGVPHLESGNLVRQAAQDDKGLIGDAARNALATGKYMPDSEMFVLWKKRLKQEDARKGWVIDGFPRNPRQAKFLFNKVAKYGYSVDKVFYLTISENETLRRLRLRHREQFAGSGRNHDDPSLVSSRLQEFKKGQEKLLEFLKQQGVLEEVDGERSIEEINADISRRLRIKHAS